VSELPETRFTKAGDVDIAYQIAGPAGGLDLVFLPGWVSHLEVMCREAVRPAPRTSGPVKQSSPREKRQMTSSWYSTA
jgi:hypothetical protein